MNKWARFASVFALVGMATLSACGQDDSQSSATLPPIATTTTTTTIPPTTTTLPDFYVIQAGDSLSSIAKMFGIDMATLQAVNEITNPDKIYSGLKLKIPQPGVTVPPVTAPVVTSAESSTTAAP